MDIKRIITALSLVLLFSCNTTLEESTPVLEEEVNVFEHINLTKIDESEAQSKLYIPYEQLKYWAIEAEEENLMKISERTYRNTTSWIGDKLLCVLTENVACSYELPALFSFYIFLDCNSTRFDINTEIDLKDVIVGFSNTRLSSCIPVLKSFGLTDDQKMYNIKVNVNVDCHTKIGNEYFKFYFTAKFNINLQANKTYHPREDIPCEVKIGIEF